MSREDRSIRAEIVTTGTEILLGDIVDTNAAWLAQQLREAGVNLYYKTTVGDNESRLRGVLELALSRSDVIIVSGGLGPTADDITRDGIANATGTVLEEREELVEELRRRFARWGNRQMTENNLRQAMIPSGSTVLPNPVGTAPGFITTDQKGPRGGHVVAVPGVPREMKQMVTDHVLPFLVSLSGEKAIIRRRILRTVGIGESTIDTYLGELMYNANPTLGLAAHLGQADVRIAARAPSAEAAEALLDEMESKVRERLGEYIYSVTPGETIESVLIALLKSSDARLAIGETVSGGQIAERLRQSDGGSDVLGQSLILSELAHDDPIFEASHSGPDEESATRAARLLRETSGSDIGLVILSSGGENEDFYADRGGMSWIGLATVDRTEAHQFPFGGSDGITTAWVGNRAFDLVRRALNENG